MADEETGTGATSTGLSFEQAAAKMAESRKAAQATTAPSPDSEDAPEDPGVEQPAETGDDGTDTGDTPEGDSEQAGSEEGGQGGEQPTAAEIRSALEALPAKELDRKIYLPTGANNALEETTLREALRGNLRQADYTRKTMQLAEMAKQHHERRSQYEQVLPILVDQVKASMGERTQEQWDQLYQTDPTRYVYERDQYNNNVQKLQAMQSEQARIQQEQEAERANVVHQSVLAEAKALREKLNLKDANAAKQFAQEAHAYLSDLGLSKDEISMVVDHRSFLVIKDAIAYRKLMKAKQTGPAKAVAAGGKPPLQPGAKPPSGGAGAAKTAEQKALSQHHKQGSIDTAAAALAARRKAAAKAVR